jgi:hypothetical protein
MKGNVAVTVTFVTILAIDLWHTSRREIISSSLVIQKLQNRTDKYNRLGNTDNDGVRLQYNERATA